MNIRCWRNWLTRLRKVEMDLYLTPHFKIDSRWIKYLNVKDKTIMEIDNNRRKYVYDLGLEKNFLNKV